MATVRLSGSRISMDLLSSNLVKVLQQAGTMWIEIEELLLLEETKKLRILVYLKLTLSLIITVRIH